MPSHKFRIGEAVIVKPAIKRNVPGGVYTVTGTTTWMVTWAGGGQTGTVTVTRQSASSVGVVELVVVNS